MKKNWFFILMLSIAALSLAGTAAYFSVFGISKLFYAAGIGITILAASLEFAKLVTVSYVYRFWKTIKKGLRGFYIFAVVFIMMLTSIGIYGFLTGAYQNSANRIEMRDSQIEIAQNKRDAFANQLNRVNNSIQSSTDRINVLSGVRKSQETRLDSLYNRNYVSVARRTESQISSSDDQIKALNDDISARMKELSGINDSIAFYDMRIIELKNSDVSNEIGPYKFVADLTGMSMNKVVNIVALLIILVFDPLAIALLIGVNQLTMYIKNEDEYVVTEEKKKYFFKKNVEPTNEPVNVEPVNEPENVEPENEPANEPVNVEPVLIETTTTTTTVVPTFDIVQPVQPVQQVMDESIKKIASTEIRHNLRGHVQATE